ncbi:hypothetical protein [Actinoplanes sp. NPDC048796]|uniref:hypothetical protein n=1 Tax=unclassified Actinoplanes TaxID=2626549 RepID=UPI0033E9275C
MVRKLVARIMVVVAAATASVVAFGAPAMAFTKRTECIYDGVDYIIGQKIYFVADNGRYKGEVNWYFGSPNSFGIFDLDTSDTARTELRVDVGSTVRSYDQSADDNTGILDIPGTVRKYRVVWDGHPTIWLPPQTCNLVGL